MQSSVENPYPYTKYVAGYSRKNYGAEGASPKLIKKINDGIATSQVTGKTGRKVPFQPRGLSLPEGMQNKDTVVDLFQRGGWLITRP
eukprot:5173368-Alexandrium_andersonii.AAC.1